jgi:hypothetical protein
MIGIYNAVWAGTSAVAYFTGGALLDWLGLPSLFYVPMVLLIAELALTIWLADRARRSHGSGDRGSSQLNLAGTGTLVAAAPSPAEIHPQSPLRARTFLRMAWLANPFAYVGVNTLIAVMPGIAHRLQLSTMQAGFWGSLWCFARLGTFVGLWLWPGWHYRLRWLLAAYLALVCSFITILLAPDLPVLVAAQMTFGAAIGLVYYSSLFYSMDMSETKGEHGGIHEAAIGLGNCAGPAVGAAALQFFPQHGHSGAVAVTLLLLCGLVGLAAIGWSGRVFTKKRQYPP